MKKIFAILLACVFGAFVADASHYKLEGINPRYAELMATPSSALEKAEKEGRVMRHTSVVGDYIYTASFSNEGALTDFWFIGGENNQAMTFKELPFHIVVMNLTRAPKENPEEVEASVICYTSWPTEAFISSKNPMSDLKGDGDNKPNGFDETLTRLVTIEELVRGSGLCNKFLFPSVFEGEDFSVDNLLPGFNEDGTVAYYPIWSPMIGSSGDSKIGNDSYVLISDPASEKYSQFEISSFDAEDNNLTMPFDFYFGSDPMKPIVKTQISGTYSGVCELHDMVLREYSWTPERVDIYNGGITVRGGNNDPDGSMYPYTFGFTNTDWAGDKNTFEPVQEFYMTAVDNGITFEINSEEESISYNPSLLKVHGNVVDARNNYIQGAFWTSNDSFLDHTIFLKPPLSEYFGFELHQIWCASPEPNIALQGGYNYDWSIYRGLVGSSEGVPRVFEAPTYFAFGTPDGFTFIGRDKIGNTYNISGIDAVNYHSNPKDMRVYEVVEVKGDYKMEDSGVGLTSIDEGININVADGAIKVTSDKDIEVHIYNLHGTLVAKAKVSAATTASFPADKGAYIVKAGKTAKKLLL